MPNYKLMIPGPVDVEDEVLSEMASPVPAHYGDEWMKTYGETIDYLKRVFQTENDLFIVGGPGSAALDASFGSLLATGEKVLIPSNGFFGQRLRTIARGYGLGGRAPQLSAGAGDFGQCSRGPFAKGKGHPGRGHGAPRDLHWGFEPPARDSRCHQQGWSAHHRGRRFIIGRCTPAGR